MTALRALINSMTFDPWTVLPLHGGGAIVESHASGYSVAKCEYTADARLIVTLANAANEVEALVEAVGQIVKHNVPDESGHYGELGSIDGDMLRSAHAALVAKLEGKA